MTNPARELHATFSEWSAVLASGNQTVIQARAATTDDFQLDSITHLNAMQHLLDVAVILDDLEVAGAAVTTFRRYLPRWTEMLVNYPHPWQGQVVDAQSAFPPAALDILETLSAFIDVRRPRLADADRASLRKTARTVLDLIDEDQTITPQLRAYLSRLAREMDAALEDEDLPAGFDVEEAIRRLWVGLHAAAGQSTDETTRAKWRDTASQIFISTVGSALGSAPAIIMGILSAPPVM